MRKKTLSRRQISLVVIFFLLSTIALISLMGNRFSEMSLGGYLNILSKDTIPLREISGSYHFQDKKQGKNFVYTVGDASSEISISEIDLKNKKILNTYFIDIKEKILERFSICQTKSIKLCKDITEAITKQWEALYVDPDRRIYLLNESLGTILVYHEPTEKISHLINLNRFTLEEKKGKTTNQNFNDSNSLGEGFLPLNNGHILVVKEDYPPSLLEFGPKGSQATGFKKELLIDESHPYPFGGERAELEPLAVWKLPDSFHNCDFSELIYSENTGLNILSQKCQAIFEIENPEISRKSLVIRETYKLPRSVTKAEAFITLPQRGEFLVFEDKKSLIEHNFYFLARAPLTR